MSTVNIQQAKTQLSALLARVEQGEEVVIARAGSPVARLVPTNEPVRRTFGGMRIEVPDDFDAPLSDDELALWE